MPSADDTTTAYVPRVCDNTRLFVRSLTCALSMERDDELRLQVQALRDTMALQIADHDGSSSPAESAVGSNE